MDREASKVFPPAQQKGKRFVYLRTKWLPNLCEPNSFYLLKTWKEYHFQKQLFYNVYKKEPIQELRFQESLQFCLQGVLKYCGLHMQLNPDNLIQTHQRLYTLRFWQNSLAHPKDLIFFFLLKIQFSQNYFSLQKCILK